MPNRSRDSFAQAEGDLEQAKASQEEGRHDRPLSWDLTSLSVPASILIYTEAEWRDLQAEGGRFARTLAREVVWVYP